MSCNATFRDEFERTIPVSPPIVNKKIKPKAQNMEGCALFNLKCTPCRVASQLKTLTPVGIAIIIVAAVK